MHHHHRCLLAATNARRRNDPHLGTQNVGQSCQQILGTRHLAGQGIAHPDGQRRYRRIALFHHIKVVIESRDLIHLGHRHVQLGRQRGEMRCGKLVVTVLNAMQIFDQQITPTQTWLTALGHIAIEQCTHFGPRLGIDRASLEPRTHADLGRCAVIDRDLNRNYPLAAGRTRFSTCVGAGACPSGWDGVCAGVCAGACTRDR